MLEISLRVSLRKEADLRRMFRATDDHELHVALKMLFHDAAAQVSLPSHPAISQLLWILTESDVHVEAYGDDQVHP